MEKEADFFDGYKRDQEKREEQLYQHTRQLCELVEAQRSSLAEKEKALHTAKTELARLRSVEDELRDLKTDYAQIEENFKQNEAKLLEYKESLKEKKNLILQCQEQLANFENINKLRDDLVFALESDNIKLRTKYVKLKAALQSIQDERQERRLKK